MRDSSARGRARSPGRSDGSDVTLVLAKLLSIWGSRKVADNYTTESVPWGLSALGLASTQADALREGKAIPWVPSARNRAWHMGGAAPILFKGNEGSDLAVNSVLAVGMCS